MTKTMERAPWPAAARPVLPGLPAPARRAAAWALRRSAAALARWARALQAPATVMPVPAREPVLEFYSEAGAPEGALYVDGVRVGVIEGVTRL